MIGDDGAFSLSHTRSIFEAMTGKELLSFNQFIVITDNVVMVKSRTKEKYYVVRNFAGTWTCSCPDAVFRKDINVKDQCWHELRTGQRFRFMGKKQETEMKAKSLSTLI
jgi:hypothetical protein